uniref:Signal recognition particle receptor subunit beta n=1 Tax=Lygus hesperus TaxID=30085 RepID=A0A0A9WHU9_LYGHE
MAPEKIDQTVINIIIAVCVVLLTLVFYLIYNRVRSTKRSILLTGICGGGKTLLYTRLVLECFKNTHTSIKENVSEYITDAGSSVELVAIPGHERLRTRFLDQYKSCARGLIYVIDSATIQKEVKDVAEFLYNILTDPEIVGSCNNVLIFCNKQDIPTAKGASLIKTLLEKELNTLRSTKTHALESTEGEETKEIFLGSPAADFVFEQLHPCEVKFAEGFANEGDEKEGEEDLEQLKTWIEKIV